MYFLLGTLAVVLAVDMAVGFLMERYVRNNRLPGDSHSIDYTIKDADEDVIIFGNSLVLNSMMPSIISDSLGMSVYNSASNGQGLIFFKNLMDIVLSRHTPKVIVVGLRDGMLSDDSAGERYGILAPYYNMGYRGIDSTMNANSPMGGLMLHSSLFRYNTIWWRLLLYHIVKDKTPAADGFIAKPIPSIFPPKQRIEVADSITDHNRRLLDEMISTCRSRGVRLVIVNPPLYSDFVYRPGNSIEELRRICSEQGVPLLEYAQDPYYLDRQQLFFDEAHLNENGARIFSSQVASDLKKVLSSCSN